MSTTAEQAQTTDGVYIVSLEIKDTKRIEALLLKPEPTGLTVLGGLNEAGKTTALDVLTWVLCGDKHKPSQAHRDGAEKPPFASVEFSNGYTVERRGKNSDLHVTGPDGGRGNQTTLTGVRGFVNAFALDLPGFLHSSDRYKLDSLLNGLGDGIAERYAKLRADEKAKEKERREYHGEYQRLLNVADSLPAYPDGPRQVVSSAELIAQQRAIETQNAENGARRQKHAENQAALSETQEAVEELTSELATDNARRSESNIALAKASQKSQSASQEYDARKVSVNRLREELRKATEEQDAAGRIVADCAAIHNEVRIDVAHFERASSNTDRKLTEAQGAKARLAGALAQDAATVALLVDQPTGDIAAQLDDLDAQNEMARANLAKSKARAAAAIGTEKYENLSAVIAQLRADEMALIDGANMPLPDLSVEDDELRYQGKSWDCMSGAAQRRVGVAIAQRLDPSFRCVCVDEAECWDVEALAKFAGDMKAQGLQVIATRVSTGAECDYIIANGVVSEVAE